jgi:hypothetical protein
MPLTVTEILGRAQEGRTQPYICRCDDGEVYFVKGKSATRFGLISEWLCARLCSALDLPIAKYAIATVPDEIMEADLTGEYQELGKGPVFASGRVKATNLSRLHLRTVPQALRRDVILFDWWVHNGDRTLTEMGGNPNLLWLPGSPGTLVMIDHNLAFDAEFNAKEFLDLHVFSSEASELFSDFLLRDSYRARLAKALESWPDICDTLPDAWHFIDAEKTMPVGYPFEAIKSLLDRALTDAFWQLPPI